jgi:hypothetical protein
MTDEQPPPRLALTGLQRDRIEYARRDLEDARAADLTHPPPASSSSLRDCGGASTTR